MARTLLNNAQLQKLLSTSKVHARAMDIEGAAPLTGSLVGGDLFVVQGSGETPTKITATQMAAFMASGGIDITEDDSQNAEHRIVFVDAGSGSETGVTLQVDSADLTYNPVTDVLTMVTASVHGIKDSGGNAAIVFDGSGNTTVAGNLTVNGTQTIVNSTTIQLDDKNIELANGLGDDAAVNGAGITIDSSDGDKTFQFEATGDNFGSSENLSLASGKAFKINNVEVLSATGLTIGSAAMSEADLEQLDGITAGTVAASKAVVVSSDLDAGAFRNLTASLTVTAGILSGSKLVVGSADMSEADLEKLDGITNGAAAASKAVVLDSSSNVKDINKLGASELSASVKDLNIRSGGTSSNAGNVIIHAKGGTIGGHAGLIVSSSTAEKGLVTFTGDSSNSAKMQFEAGGSIGVVKYDGSSGFTLQGAGGITAQADSGNATFKYNGGAQLVISSTKPKFEMQSGNGSRDGVSMNGRDLDFSHNFETVGIMRSYKDSSSGEHEFEISGTKHMAISASGGTLVLTGSDGIRVVGTGVADTTATATDVLYFRDSDGLMKTDRVQDILELAAGDGLTGASGVLSVDPVELIFYSASSNTGAAKGMSANLLTASFDTGNDGNVLADSLQVFLNGMLQTVSASAATSVATVHGIFDCRISGAVGGHETSTPVAICLDSALDSDDVLTIRYLKK